MKKHKLFSFLTLPLVFSPLVVTSCHNGKQFFAQRDRFYKIVNIDRGLVGFTTGSQYQFMLHNCPNKFKKYAFKEINFDKTLTFTNDSGTYKFKNYFKYDFDNIAKYYAVENKEMIRSNKITKIDDLFNLTGELGYLEFNQSFTKLSEKLDIDTKYINRWVALPNLQYMLYLSTSIGDKKSSYPLYANRNLASSMRLESSVNNTEQIELWANTLTYYVKTFNLQKDNQKFAKAKIVNMTIENDYVVANIDLLDNNNQSMLTTDQKKVKFYIKGFKQDKDPILRFSDKFINKQTNKTITFGDINNEIKELFGADKVAQPLFNEALKLGNTRLKFRPKNPLGFTEDFDANTMHFSSIYKAYNLNGVSSLIQSLNTKDNIDQDLVIIKTNSQDKQYKIVDFKPSELLNNSYSLAYMLLDEYTNDNVKTGKQYIWYSYDFAAGHAHPFTVGFYTKAALGLDENFDNPKNKDMWGYSYNSKSLSYDANGFLIRPKGIEADDFFEKCFKDVVNFYLTWNNINNSALLWNNKSQSACSILEVMKNKDFYEKYLSILFSRFPLLHYINNPSKHPDKKDSYLIKKVKVIIDPNHDYYQTGDAKYGLGKLPVSFSFIDNENKEMLSYSLKQKVFTLGGFLGFDNSEVNKQKEKLKSEVVNGISGIDYYAEHLVKDKTLPYLEEFSK